VAIKSVGTLAAIAIWLGRASAFPNGPKRHLLAQQAKSYAGISIREAMEKLNNLNSG
jgi:hypothetical protein